MSMTRQEVLRALADGKEVECQPGDAEPWGAPFQIRLAGYWIDGCWRIKPTRKTVPLGPEDVPPWSVVRNLKHYPGVSWFHVNQVDSDRIEFNHCILAYDSAKISGWEISRDGGKTWNKCEKEV